MKLKPLVVTALCVLLVGALWFSLHRRDSQPSKAETVSTPLPTRVSHAIDTKPKLLPVALNVVKEEPASAAIQTLVDSHNQYGERVAVIKTLDGKLSKPDEAALQAFLLQPGSSDDSQLEQVLKNQML